MMTSSSPEIEFGLGYASFGSQNSIEDSAKNAMQRAIKDAGRKSHQKPKALIVGVWNPNWHKIQDALDSIEEVIGKKTLLIGQCPGGPQPVMICNQHVIQPKGIILAAIYTNLPIGIYCKAGFETRNLASGIVTKTSGNIIHEIDHKDAVKVYKNWSRKSKDIVRDAFVLQPLYREYRSKSRPPFHLFSQPVVKTRKRNGKREDVLITGTEIKVGEKIYLTQGNWQILLNRISLTSANAKFNADINKNEAPLFSFLFICCGITSVIPDSFQDQIPVLINKENKAPFIASIAWGEQMYYPGIGYKHGNLHISCLVIGRKKKK